MVDKEEKDNKETTEKEKKVEHDAVKNDSSLVNIDHISPDEIIIDTKIEDEMRTAYINYAMSVIVARALPSVEDGLKPVQRRILHAMNEMGLASNKPTKKSARIVGEVLGKFHPHGDSSVYEAMVRMAQEFSLRYPLVTGQGNFGSIDGDPPAAMRYCITGDSLIVTEKGLQEINEISSKEDIKLKVLSKDKKIHNAIKWFDSGEHETIKITTNKGYNLTCSKNHPILTLSKNNYGKPIFLWKLLDQIQEGDITIIDRREDSFWPENKINLQKYYPLIKDNHQHKKILPLELDETLAFILGSLISEGTIAENKIEFCNSNNDFIELFKNKWNKTFPDSKLHEFLRKASSYGKKDYKRLECHCRYTIEFLRNIGLAALKSNKKTVPKLILQSPKLVVSSFINSYFEGDGSISFSDKMIELSCCSKSSELIRQLQIILLRFGIDTFRRYDSYKFIDKLYLRGKKNIVRFYKNINFACENKKKKLEFVILNYKKETSVTDFVPFISDFIRGLDGSSSSFIAKNNFDRYDMMQKNHQKVASILFEKTGMDYCSLFEYLLDYNYLFDYVSKIEDTGIQKVYSLKIESECHTFISNGFISHNTEAKLSSISEELLLDIDKKTVKMLPNFDNSLTEPETLPAKLPNLLINGCQGIAVGMMTSIPPHNLNEVCDATLAYIKNPEIDIDKLMEFVLGPDLPTYGAIQKEGISDMYKTGRGAFVMRGKVSIEEEKDREKIIITELPYQVNKADLIKKIAALTQEKRLDDISDIRDESAKEKIRIVIFLKKGANSKLIINKLYHLTDLQCKFNSIMLALVNGQPRILNLKQFLENYVKYRKEIIRKRTQFDLKNAQDQEHILEGLMICLKNLDDVIALIKKAKGTTDATEQLMTRLKLSQKQAQAILEMKLQKLTVLEQDKLKKDFEEIKKKITELEVILASEQIILDIIKQDLHELKRKYGDDRRTRIIERVSQVNEIDLIKKEEVAVMMTSKGYIKRMPLSRYQEQHRGGKGVTGSDLTTGDFMQSVFICSTHDYILFITERGRMYLIKAYNLPEADRYAKGKPIVNILNMNEKIKSTIPLKEFKDQLFIVTEKGIAKSLDLTNFAKIRQSGIKVISLPSDDFVVEAKMVNQKSEALIATKEGTVIRFPVNEVRIMGNNAYGVTAINLEKEDRVIGLEVFDSALLEKAEKENQQDLTILTVTEKGFGKRTVVQDYRRTHRGGKGVTNMNCSERNGKVAGIQVVTGKDGLIITTAKGMVIRVPLTDIREMGRNTQGVRIIKISDQDSVTDVVKIQQVE